MGSNTDLDVQDNGLKRKRVNRPSEPKHRSPAATTGKESDQPVNANVDIDEGVTCDECIDQNVLGVLQRLQSQGTSNLVAKLIRLYIQDSRKHIETLQDAIERRDAARIQSAAHTLKSASANLGAMRMAELCKALELEARQQDTAKASELLAGIQAEHREVVAALGRELEAQARPGCGP